MKYEITSPKIICPYCKKEIHFLMDIMECIYCKKKFRCKMARLYTTKRDCELNKEKHKFSEGKCSRCGKEESQQ